MKKNRTGIYFFFLLSLLLVFPISIFGQLSGTKTIGGASPDYPTIKAAINALNAQGVTSPGVTFLIRGGTYAEDSLRIRTSTSNATAPIVFKPDAGASVVINVSPPNTTYNFAIKIDTTQYVTIDGSNNGTTSRDLTINSSGTSGQRGIWVSGASHYTTIKNCNVNAGKDIVSPTTSVRCIDLLYSGATQNPSYALIENNFLRYAYTGVRLEGNVAGDVVESAIIRNNVIDSVGNAGVYSFYQNNTLIYNNNINILRGSSATIYGLYVGSTSANVQVYSNQIHDINQLSTTTSATYFIYVSTTSTLGVISVYNNFIWNAIVPATGTGTIYGIYSGTANSSTPDVFAFNSVNFSGTSGGNRLSYAFYKGSSTGPANLYNNILQNTRTDGTTGIAYAIYKTTAATVLNSNNNNMYVGTPDAQHQTGRISTTNYATLADWRAANSSDALSFVENSPFVSTTNLHIQTGVPTQIESGGIPITGITTDIDGDTRNVSTPDVGGDEFAGIPLDLTPPAIVFTPLLNTSSISARTLTVNISDAGSGVPTAGIGLPVLYWRINSGAWTPATATYLSGDDYQFSFGGGVVLGDTVRYYICAQDGATTPNVTSNPLTGASGFTANPPAASTPPTTPASYRVSDVALAGDYTVGVAAFNMITGKNIYFEKVTRKVVKEVEIIVPLEESHGEEVKGSEALTKNSIRQTSIQKQLQEVEEVSWIPMENGVQYTGDLYVKKIEHPEINFPAETDGVYLTITAAVADLNLRGVSGPVKFLFTDSDYSAGETFPITINIQNENLPTSTNTVTFKPNTNVTSVITGATAQNVFGIYDDYIIFDGSNSAGGTSRDLTIVNTYTGASFNLVVVLWNAGGKGASNVTVQNCIVEGTPTTTSSYGLFLNAAGGAFDNTSFINNKIQNVKIGIQFAGVAGSTTNDGLISGNVIGDLLKPVKIGGILGSQVDNLTIVGNEIFGEEIGNTNTSQYGISIIAGSTNTKIQKNYIHDFFYSGTSGYGCFGIRYNSDASTVTEISNNVIYNIKGDGDASSLTYTPAGIYIITGGNVNVYYNSIYMSGSTLGAGTTYDGRSGCLTVAAGITQLDVRDNIFQNSMDSFPGSTRTNTTYGVYSSSANTAYTFINYNDYYVNGINPYVGYLGANQLDLTAWQTATGQDANSISANPLFQSTIDLQPAGNSPVINAATPLAAVTTDILGVTRDAATPSMGAYEDGLIVPLAGDYTVGLSAFRQFSGLNITFEKRVRTVEVTETVINPEAEEQLGIYEETSEGTVTLQEPAEASALIPKTITRTVDQEYLVPMLNGSKYEGRLYYKFTPEQINTYKLTTLGVYPTITAAKDDAILRGVSAAVRFILVDTTYQSETFPILITEIPGASASNTVTILPATGVTSLISGSPTNTQIFDLSGVDYFIFDGRSGGVGTSINLTIENLTSTGTSSHTIRLINGATNNVLRYVRIINSTQPTAGPRAVDFGASASDPAGNSFNLVENCYISGGRTGLGFAGTAANPNSNNSIIGNMITDFSFAGVWLSSNTSNTTIDNNEFFQTVPVVTSGTGINLSTSGIINIQGNKFYDLQNSTTSTLRGISGSPSAGGTVNIINNFFSFTLDNGTKTSIYAIQISGTTEHTANIFYNSFNIGGVHTGGTAGVLVSGGLIKSNTGATSTFNAKDNISINTRTGGTTGVIHTNFFAGGTSLVGTIDIDYNVWYAFGDPGSFSAGWNGYVYNDQQAYRDSAAPHEQNTIFKDVNYVSGTDLHLTGSSLGDADLAGFYITGITLDIDGDTRDLTYPYRGADEGNVPFLPILSPSNLAAIPDTFTVDLSWQDNSVNESAFVIQRKDGDSLSVNPWVNIDTVNANVINYLDTGLNPNSMYTYRVFGYNSLGTSGFSNMVEVTTFIPVELSSFTADVSGREIMINWITATELNNSGFDVERNMNGEWEIISFVKGKGTTTEESYYSYTDKFTYESFVGTISYRLKQMDFDGKYSYSPVVEVNVDFTPKEYTLYQNYPNPFNPSTTIKYSLPFDSNVRIAVYNVLGELLSVLVDQTKEVGFHDLNWNASNLASGIYIYTIEAKSVAGDKSYSSVKKMILMK